MKLIGHLAVQVSGEDILRRPGLWDRVRRAFGGEPDLRTGRRKAALEAEAAVDAVRAALRRIGVGNAVSLVIDDQVIFHDRDGTPDDLGDLFLAFHEAAPVQVEFKTLRLAVEHVEAGLHLVLEVQARTEHAASEPAVRVIVSGRQRDLEPRADEDAAAYRARVEPLTTDKAALDVARLQFTSFVERVRDAMATAMPEAQVELQKAEAQIVRPAPRAAAASPPRPDSRHYDPHQAHYPSPLQPVLDGLLWGSIFAMLSHPDVIVVNDAGTPIGHIDQPGIEHAPDPGPGDSVEAPAGDGAATEANPRVEADDNSGGHDSSGGYDNSGGYDSGGGYDSSGSYDSGGGDGGGGDGGGGD